MPDEEHSRSLQELAAALLLAKERLDEAKAAVNDATAVFDETERQLAEAMDAGQEPMLVSGGLFLTRKLNRRWSIPAAHRERVIELFKAHEPELVKESIHAGSLTSFAKEILSRPDAPSWWSEAAPLLEEHTSVAVSVTKTRPRR